MRLSLNLVLILALACFITSCTREGAKAPVVEFSMTDPIPKSGSYRVRPNDTLYSIAWDYGLDYRALANINHISRPYHIQAGQIIYLKNSKSIPTIRVSVAKVTPVYEEPFEKEPSKAVSYWQWPARGSLLGSYSTTNKGINIVGHRGDLVLASAPGKVVYSGNGLRAYGNLIIIKHNSEFLSAYAHNKIILVKEGQWVSAGQKIAEMGNTGSRRVMLHFEIRRGGKPVNPLVYLAS